jgi:hypothetical protein
MQGLHPAAGGPGSACCVVGRVCGATSTVCAVPESIAEADWSTVLLGCEAVTYDHNDPVIKTPKLQVFQTSCGMQQACSVQSHMDRKQST